jgi:prepilin-type N-terminal cleavage/methylation domain-containing protein
MDGKHKGFTLIEILVVVTIIGVLAGLVVVLIPKGQFEAQKTECINNCRQLAGLLVPGDKYPEYGGPNMLLYYVIKGEISRDQDKLKILFCPGDVSGWSNSGGTEAYKDLDLKKRDYDHLTSYAGRDQTNRACAVRKGDTSTQVLLCDEDEAYHGKKGLVVGLNDGSAKWRDKVDYYSKSIDTEIQVGEGSAVEELTCLRRE